MNCVLKAGILALATDGRAISALVFVQILGSPLTWNTHGGHYRCATASLARIFRLKIARKNLTLARTSLRLSG